MLIELLIVKNHLNLEQNRGYRQGKKENGRVLYQKTCQFLDSSHLSILPPGLDRG